MESSVSTLTATPRQTLSAPRALQLRLSPVPLVFALVFLLFFFQLGARDLVSSHEARAAQNAQRMIDTGDWGLPTLFDGQADLQKPPGYYWLVAVTSFANGGHVSPWVARFPAAVSSVIAVAVVFLFLRSEGYNTGALFGAIALATANHFVAIGRTARIDVPLACAVACSLLAFYRGCLATRGTALRWYSLSAIAAGFAVLLKGPVALALIGTTAIAFLVVERTTTKRERRARLPLWGAFFGTAVVACVALPWFVYAQSATNGEFARVFFWHHNVDRFAGTAESLASHPWWYYGPRFAMAFLPWTLLLVPLVVWSVRSGLWKQNRVVRFGFVWLVAMLAVLSASQFKRADYLLPAFPGAAIALGCAAEEWIRAQTAERRKRAAQWCVGVLTLLAVAVWPVMWFVVEPAEAARHEKRPFAAAIRAHATTQQTIVLFRTESHLLAYHLGCPLHTLVEWGDLKDTLAARGQHVIVMPPEYVSEAEQITGRKLVPVASLADYTRVRPHRSLVCVRTADLP
jgi:4-amino-4-deoxy-L-arabinose transferase-like glycosyltransferase